MILLNDKINAILKEEQRAYAVNGRARGGLGSFNLPVPNEWTLEGGPPPELVIPDCQTDSLHSANADLLLRMHNASSMYEQSSFKVCLFQCLNKKSPFANVGYLILFVLHRIEELRITTLQAIQHLRGDSEHGFSNAIAMLALIVKYEHCLIDTDTLQFVDRYLKQNGIDEFRIRERINSAKVQAVKRELADINPEINTDKEKVINLWSAHFGDGPVSSAVATVEEFFRGGDFDEIKYAACTERVRAFLSEVFKQLAQNVSSQKSDGKINGSTNEHAALEYLKNQKFLTDYEWNMARSLHALTSDTGAHQLVGLREYARIAKNMAYELVLLLLTRWNEKDNIPQS